jgi:hypothetical protein
VRSPDTTESRVSPLVGNCETKSCAARRVVGSPQMAAVRFHNRMVRPAAGGNAHLNPPSTFFAPSTPMGQKAVYLAPIKWRKVST